MRAAARIFVAFWAFGPWFNTLPGAMAALPELPDALDKLRIVLLVDTQAENVGSGIENDLKNLEKSFDGIFKNPDYPRLQKKKVTTDVLGKNESLSAKRIETYFSGNPLEKEEGLLVYFSGHGGYDPSFPIGGHLLQLSSKEVLPRRTLRTWIDAQTNSPLH